MSIYLMEFINVPGEILPADLVGVSIGVGSLISAFSCPEGVAMGVAYQAFNILTAAQMVSSTSMYLRPFIEVVDYEDKDGDGVFDPGEPINKTKWVEVIGVFRIEDRENNMYVPGSGYSPTSWLAAIYGTLLAQEYYPLEAPDENRAQMTDPDTYWTWGAEFWLLSDIVHDNDSMTNIGMPALCPIHWVPWGMCPN